MVAVNLAAALARTPSRTRWRCSTSTSSSATSPRACSLAPEHTLADVVRSATTVDATSLKVFLTAHTSGLWVLAAPETPADADDVSRAGRRLDACRLLGRGVPDRGRRHRPPASTSSRSPSLERPPTAVRAHHGRLEHPGAAQGARPCSTRSAAQRPRRHLVLNRADSKVGPRRARRRGGPRHARRRRPRQHPGRARSPLNQGVPLAESDPRAAITRQLDELAGRFVHQPAADIDRKRRLAPPEEGRPMKLSERLRLTRARPGPAAPQPAGGRSRTEPVAAARRAGAPAALPRPRRPTRSPSSSSAPRGAVRPARRRACSTPRSPRSSCASYVRPGDRRAHGGRAGTAQPGRAPALVGEISRRRARATARSSASSPTRPSPRSWSTATGPIYVERVGPAATRPTSRFMSERPPAPGHRAHRRRRRPPHRRVVADGRRPPARRLPRQRGDPAPGGRRPGAHRSASSPATRFKVDDLIGFATLTPRSAAVLNACVWGKLNMLISGGTGSGKTTLLNVALGVHPRRRARRHDRGRGRAAAPPAPRRAPRDPPRQHRGPGPGRRSATSCATPCACGPTASSSARSAAARPSTCSRP